MVPPAEMKARREAMRARCKERRQSERAAIKAFRAEIAEKSVGGMILGRLFGRAA
jgi:hypothetical protein